VLSESRPQVLVAADGARTDALLRALRAEPIDVHAPTVGSDAIAFLRHGRPLDVVLASPRFGELPCSLLMQTARDAHLHPAWILLATADRAQGLLPDVLRQFSVSFPFDADPSTIVRCVRTVLEGRARAQQRTRGGASPTLPKLSAFSLSARAWLRPAEPRPAERASLEEVARTRETRIAIVAPDAARLRMLSTIFEAAGLTAHGFTSPRAVRTHALSTSFGAIVVDDPPAGEAARLADELADQLGGGCPAFVVIADAAPRAPLRARFARTIGRAAPADDLIVAVRRALAPSTSP
jgi:hypothetical protein